MPTKNILEVPELRMPPYSGHAVVVPMVFALEGFHYNLCMPPSYLFFYIFKLFFIAVLWKLRIDVISADWMYFHAHLGIEHLHLESSKFISHITHYACNERRICRLTLHSCLTLKSHSARVSIYLLSCIPCSNSVSLT